MTRGPRWHERRRAALAVRLIVLAAPLLAAIAAVQLVAGVAPVPRGSAALLWWAGLLVVASAAAGGADRVARRLLPLAELLRLSLPFPGTAPSRWRMARQASTARVRQHHVSTARRWRRLGPADETPEQAAHRVLPLVLAVSADGRTAPGHVDRVVATTDLLSRELDLPADERDALRWSALLSPLGLLTTRRRVAADSARLAGGLLPWLGRSGDAVAGAGERYDAGAPLGARVLAVATAFATLSSPDERGRPPGRDDVLEQLRARAGTTLDPALVALLAAAPPASLAYAFGPWARVSAGLLGSAGLSVPVTAAALGLTLTAVGLGGAGAPPLGERDRLARDGALLDSQAAEAMGGVGPRSEQSLTLGEGATGGLGAPMSAQGSPSAGSTPASAGAVPTASPSPVASPVPSASMPAPATGSPVPTAPTTSPSPRPARPPSGTAAPAPAPAGSPAPQRSPSASPSSTRPAPTAQPSTSSTPKPERSKRPKGEREPSPEPSESPRD